MSKTLSYANLTAYADDKIRDHMTDVAEFRAAGDDVRAGCAWAAAAAIYAMWDSLALQHLDAPTRRSYLADYIRLSALVMPDPTASGSTPS